MARIPTVLWSQRKDKIFLTIDVQDAKEPKVEVKNAEGHGTLVFSGKAGSDSSLYELTLNFLKEVDADNSKINITPRNVVLVVAKPEGDIEHWPRLTKEPGKQHTHIKVDWDKWVDEDEEDDKPEPAMDMSQFGDLGGMMGGGGGMGGMAGMMGGMGGMMGGMGGMGGMAGLQGMNFTDLGGEGSDSDDEDLPDLESAPAPQA
jgi:hypothetical protein